MIPEIELYLNTERDWVSDALIERFVHKGSLLNRTAH